MVAYLIRSFEQHIKQLTWMSDATKEKALAKLARFTVKIGYPDKWKDYSGLEVGDSLFANVLNARQWRLEDNRAKQGKPEDETEWGLTPKTMTATERPLSKEIVYPAQHRNSDGMG